jgi:hypothetical protein
MTADRSFATVAFFPAQHDSHYASARLYLGLYSWETDIVDVTKACYIEGIAWTNLVGPQKGAVVNASTLDVSCVCIVDIREKGEVRTGRNLKKKGDESEERGDLEHNWKICI